MVVQLLCFKALLPVVTSAYGADAESDTWKQTKQAKPNAITELSVSFSFSFWFQALTEGTSEVHWLVWIWLRSRVTLLLHIE